MDKPEKYLAIKQLPGIYVGDREDMIKIRPFYGLDASFSDYFIVNENQIEEIRLYEITRIEKPPISSSRKI